MKFFKWVESKISGKKEENQDKIDNAKDKASENIHNIKEDIKDAAHDFKEDAKELASSVRDIAEGKYEQVKEAINKGWVDINSKDENGDNMLIHSLKAGQEKISEFLIKSGIETKANHALEVAKEYKQDFAAKLIEVQDKLVDYKEHAKDVFEAIKVDSKDYLQKAIDKGADLEEKFEEGETALLRAVREKKFELAEVLVKNGADVNVEDASGHTPLYYAVAYDNGNVKSILLENGANPYVNIDGKTVLVVDNAQEIDYLNPVYEAANGHTDTLKTILNYDHSKIENTNGMGDTPLLVALKTGHFDTAKFLVDNGANIYAADKFGITPVDYARFEHIDLDESFICLESADYLL
ncbi:MAG: ankyrin repeat domain-containing protein [Alphaproteobacteria bacterium]|nr:ankyrin repeat domain-containing protein [Alphaproteobacteria bacterium]OJV17239.1 MAG: hypothetical protein BGO27_06150 [Alphaproteobacteria bacterium 33-17]